MCLCHARIYTYHQNRSIRFLASSHKVSSDRNEERMKIPTFIIFTNIRLIVDNCNGPNCVGTSLRTYTHSFRNLLVLLYVRLVCGLPSVLSIIRNLFILSFSCLLFDSLLQHQFLKFVTGQNFHSCVYVRTSGCPLHVRSFPLWSIRIIVVSFRYLPFRACTQEIRSCFLSR